MTQTMVGADVRLKSDIVGELEWTPGLDDVGIDVAVIAGEVILAGAVATYPQKLLAIDAARRVFGVGPIHDHIVIADAGTIATDGEIIERVNEALWDSVEFPDFVEVSVDHQVLSLSGQVRWEYQRAAAVRSVRDVKGVRAVANGIVLRPAVAAAGMRTAITTAFHRNAELRDADITVTTEVSGLIILDGSVGSWAKLLEAERTAWCAPGATVVANHLRIST